MARKREKPMKAPDAEYRSDEQVLVLRGAMTPKTREAYRETLNASAVREDAWQRAVEFLFERLAVSWSVAGAEPLSKQKELLGRFRFATIEERRWIREQLRAHLAEHFPELPAP